MDEYIERKKVYSAVSRLLNSKNATDFTKYEEGFDDAVCKIMSIIEETPATDVRPERHGAWIANYIAGDEVWDDWFECSLCGGRSDDGSNEEQFCPHCGAKMDGKPNNWILTAEQKPPKNLIVDTKIDDKDGIRNEQQLIFHDNLWWFPDNSMYVYYTPTHWKYADKMDGKDGD